MGLSGQVARMGTMKTSGTILVENLKGTGY